jgi:hypothetical protein
MGNYIYLMWWHHGRTDKPLLDLACPAVNPRLEPSDDAEQLRFWLGGPPERAVQ